MTTEERRIDPRELGRRDKADRDDVEEQVESILCCLEKTAYKKLEEAEG